MVSDWIGQTEFVGAKNVWYVMSCGSGIGGADIYNRKLSEKKGLKHMGTAQIIMPENYIAMFNAPDVEKAKKIVAAAGLILLKLCWRSNMERSFCQKVAWVLLLRVVW